MNFLGVGPAELVIILILLLVVAGPKRMVQWAYVAGQYVAQLRAMWQEASRMVQQELEQAGIEPEVIDTLKELSNNPRQLQRRANPLNSVVDAVRKEVVQPVEDTLQAVGDTSLEPTPPEEKAASEDDNGAGAPSASEESEDTHQQHKPGRYDAWTPN